MRRVADRAMGIFARILIRIFFRRVTIEGGERLPVDSPIVLVANHVNGLVDGLLLMATLPRYPRFLGKSTLFNIVPLRPFLGLAGVVPIYRAKDGEAGIRNESAFSTCRALLASGRMVALFPEGISHDESMLQSLRTGAARIALSAAIDDGTPSVVTVAVGLVYDAKARFRSRALVRVGPPVDVQRWTGSYRSDARAAVRELTDDLAGQLRSVSPTYQSWQQATLLARIAEVAGRPLSSRLTDVELADQQRVAQLLAAVESYEAGRVQLGELRQTFVGYERDLAVLGLNDAQLAGSYQNDRLRLALLWSAAKVIFALPVAALGAVIHIVPYQLMKRVATRPANESIKATVKLLGCFTSFVLVYSMLAIAVARWRGLLPAGAVFAAAPLCGYTTVRLVERLQRMGGLLEGYRVVRQHRNLIPSVLATRLRVSDLTQTALAIAPRNSDPFRPIT